MRYVMDHRDWSINSNIEDYKTVAPELYTLVTLEERAARYRDLVILKTQFEDGYCPNVYSVLSRRYNSVDKKTYVKITGMQLIYDGEYFVINEVKREDKVIIDT